MKAIAQTPRPSVASAGGALVEALDEVAIEESADHEAPPSELREVRTEAVARPTSVRTGLEMEVEGSKFKCTHQKGNVNEAMVRERIERTDCRSGSSQQPEWT